MTMNTSKITQEQYDELFKKEPEILKGALKQAYSMRNMLFHGEIVPDPQTNRTYEPAYHLVRHLTRCIV